MTFLYIYHRHYHHRPFRTVVENRAQQTSDQHDLNKKEKTCFRKLEHASSFIVLQM